MPLSKPTNGSNADYANRIGLLFDAFNNGNYAFPATQVPSADANTLDDYEEGTWTPTLTFATVGNLNVVYAVRQADYTKWGREIVIRLNVQTSTFTHTTASGNCNITGLPFTASGDANFSACGVVFWGGITKASYTQIVARVVGGTALVDFVASGSGQAAAVIATGDMPTGGTVAFRGSGNYRV